MTPRSNKPLEVGSRRAWRGWLDKHHDSVSEVWLVIYKKHTGRSDPSYEDAVEEALCFGWIDGVMRRLDDDRYVQRFTPRRPGSKWSPTNRRRYADLKKRGWLAPAGVKSAPPRPKDPSPRPSSAKPPRYFAEALTKNPQALRFFKELAPSYQRTYIGWVDSAKREETKQRRLREALSLLAAGKKLGLK